jgi:hypothetical protein
MYITIKYTDLETGVAGMIVHQYHYGGHECPPYGDHVEFQAKKCPEFRAFFIMN